MESKIQVPFIIKYAYSDLKVSDDHSKWTAKCNSCKLVLTEKRGTSKLCTRPAIFTAVKSLSVSVV